MGNPGLTDGLDLLIVVGKKCTKIFPSYMVFFFMVVNPMGSNLQKKSPNKQSKFLDIHDIHLYSLQLYKTQALNLMCYLPIFTMDINQIVGK